MEKIENLLSAFVSGTSVNAYDFLGCHKNKGCFVFRVWAPNAAYVSLVGDFNNWDPSANYMESIGYGVWEGIIENAKIYDNYKYAVTDREGKTVLKADPYAFHSATRPDSASKVYDISGYKWTDSEFIKRNKNKDIISSPMNIM